MSIFKFITLSQLRKVLSALETRFKKIEYDVENPPAPDWNQNNPNTADYIKNRPFYTEPTTTTLISTTINNGESVSQGDVSSIELMSLVKDGLPYTAIWNGTIYTGVFRYNSAHFAYLFGNTYDDNGEDTGEPFTGNISLDTFHVKTYPHDTQVTEDVNFSLLINTENVHKIAEKYLNGRLIEEGLGYKSAILNDSINSGSSAAGDYAVSEGSGNAIGQYSHAEGMWTTASADASHAEGIESIASNSASHAEGQNTTASGLRAHAEGNQSTASGDQSHAEGVYTTASGHCSHAEGYGTTANHQAQHAFGSYNIPDANTANADNKGTYIEIVGNGTYQTPSNARTLDWSGNEVLAGKLTVGAAPTNNMDVATKQYVDNSLSGFSPNLSGLTDTTISSPANGQALMYDSSASKWKNQTINITSTIGQLTDTTISSPSNGQALMYDSSTSKWKNQTINLTSTVTQLTDTAISSPANGQVLMYNSTTSKWENTSLPVYNGGVTR